MIEENIYRWIEMERFEREMEGALYKKEDFQPKKYEPDKYEITYKK